MSIITHLRPARLDDCEHIFNAHEYAVRYTCARNYDNTVLAAWLKLLSPQSYVETLNNPDKKLWIVDYRGHIQGFFQLDVREAQLDALYVHPFVHNQGLGTALLQRAEALARVHGLGLLKLYASLNSVAFYHLYDYESLGQAALPLNQTITVNCELMRKFLHD